MGHPWTVDPQRGDEEPLRDRPRGGLLEGAGPDQVRPAAVDPARDLREVLTDLPPKPRSRMRMGRFGTGPELDLTSAGRLSPVRSQHDASALNG
jgi:hypothetical protein